MITHPTSMPARAVPAALLYGEIDAIKIHNKMTKISTIEITLMADGSKLIHISTDLPLMRKAYLLDQEVVVGWATNEVS